MWIISIQIFVTFAFISGTPTPEGSVQIQGSPQIMRMQQPYAQQQSTEGHLQSQQDSHQQMMMQSQNPQLIALQRQNSGGTAIQQNGQIIRTSGQQIIFQQNQIIGQPQRHVLAQNGQYVQPSQPGNQMAVGHPQVQRVPQLRMQQNFQLQRGQFRGQVPPGQQQMMSGQPRNVYMKPPPQYSIVQQQQQGSGPMPQQPQQFQQISSDSQQGQMHYIQGN